MKRIIKTSCTLMLSLAIAFGVSQNSISLGKVLNTDIYSTNVDKSVTNRANTQNLPSDNQTKVATIATEANVPVIHEETPTINHSDLTQVTARNVVPQVKGATCTNKKPVLIYKNVNLSNCKSAKDIVKTLRKNGIKNVTMKNIKNNQALKNVLAKINKNTTKTTSTKPVTNQTTTKAPTSTVKTSTTGKNTNNSGYASEVLRLVNIERQKAGLKPFTTNATLTSAANKRAQEIVQSFSHTRLDGTGFQTVLEEYGVSYRTAGENIAYGQKSPQEVVTGWMNSPGHRANILNANFNKIGIGAHQSNGVYYWTQEFTN